VDLYKLYGSTEEAVQAAKKNGFFVGNDILRSHVHVSQNVMAKLDQVYIDHYRQSSPEARILRLCFGMMGRSKESKEARERYKTYLDKVWETLTELSADSRDIRVAQATQDLQVLGLKYAAPKLDPLFGPVFGRICLPLPTISMLEDLRVCLELDSDIMGEVFQLITHDVSTLITKVFFRLAVGLMALEST
jgi:hypothetical protein